MPPHLSREIARGRRIASALAGAWRTAPPPLLGPGGITPDEFATIWRPIVRSGSGGLLWHRLRSSPHTPSEAAQSLVQCYRQQVLEEALRLRQAEAAIAALGEAGIAPLLVKGWAIARLYPGPGLRHYSDIDLVVRPAELAAARRILAGHPEGSIDLHAGLPLLRLPDPTPLHRRARRVRLREIEVDVLGTADHLRLLCLHLLLHGAWRTVWLCDVALALEREGDALDWDLLLGGDPWEAEAVRHTLALAARVLGARLDEAPAALRRQPPPGWLERSLLAEWGRDFEAYPPLTALPRHPARLWAEARRRWPNPIRATAALRAPWTGLPRWPLQGAEYALRSARFLGQRFTRRST